MGVTKGGEVIGESVNATVTELEIFVYDPNFISRFGTGFFCNL
jgi:hypothetical protein